MNSPVLDFMKIDLRTGVPLLSVHLPQASCGRIGTDPWRSFRLKVWKKPMKRKSRSNRDEAAKVLNVVNDLLAMGDLQPEDIGVISPYNGQVRELIRLFEAAGGRESGQPYHGLEIKSVDGYRGGKKRSSSSQRFAPTSAARSDFYRIIGA